MSEQPLRVLLADDETSLREPLATYLRREYGYLVDTAVNGQETLAHVEKTRGQYDVALIDDMLMPDASSEEPKPLGIKLMTEVKTHYPHIEFIIFTGWGMESALEALRAGAYRYIRKPFDPADLAVMIEHAAEYHRLKDVAREKQILERLMETSTALLGGGSLQDVLDTVLRSVQAIGFDRVRLYLLSKDGQRMVGQAQVGMGTEFVGVELHVADDPYVQALLTNPRPQVFEREADKPLPYALQLAKEEVNQWACVPLLLRGKVIGKLSVDNKLSQQPILEAELGPVALFASQAAAAIENARLRAKEQEAIQKAEQRARDLAAIQEVSTAINSTLELDEILEATCGAAVELFGVDHSGLVLFEEPGYERGWVVAEYPDLGVRGAEIPVEGIPAEERLISAKEPLVLSDAQRESSFGPVRDIFDKFDIRSILIVPVVFKGRVVGSFSLDTIGRPHSFSKDAVELCKIFAAQVAGAVANARTHDNIRKYVEKLKILHTIDAEMAAAKEVDHILNSIAKHIIRLVGARRSLFLLVDRLGKRLTKATGYGYPPEHLQGLTFEELEAGVSGWALKSGEPALITDAQSDPRNIGIALERAKQFDTVPLIVAPLLVKGEVIGTLTAVNTRDDPPFTQEDLNLVVMLANQAAIAIEKTRLYQETDQRGQLLAALDEASRNIRAEKGTTKLLQEVVRLAAELAGCTAGGLYINRPHLRVLELLVTHELPPPLVGNRLPHAEGLIGHVARTGQPKVVHGYADWPDRENILEAYHFNIVAGVPLKQAGEVEAVLFVADHGGTIQIAQTDLEILERFAAQASIALHTSRLLSREQRMFGQLAILHKISDYIQTARDLDKILHVVLTGITAGYGLGFDRAGLLLLDESRENLSGQMGIGHLDEARAREDWTHDQQHKLGDLGQYLDLLEQGALPPMPVDDNIRGLQLPLRSVDSDIFSRVVIDGQYVVVTQDELNKLPDDFIDAFEPDSPLAVVPLMARDQVIGLLVADNKFTQAPITLEDIESLLTFANTAAVAIENAQLLHETEVARKRLSSFFEASNALVASVDPQKILRDIVERVREAANASGVSMILIDQAGQARYLMTVGADEPVDIEDLIRPDGLSLKVVETGQPEVIDDVSRQRDRVNPSVFWRGIAAALCLPVSLEGNRIGVMWVHYDKPHHFSKSEIEALQLYVNQAAIAYEDARRIRELEHMRQAAEALAGAAGLQEVLEQIVKSALSVLQADSAVICSYDDVRDEFALDRSVATGISAKWWRQFQKVGPRRGGTAYTVMERGWIGVTDVDDTQKYGFMGGSTHKLLAQIGARSFQGIALTAGEEKLGLLYVNYNSPRSFSEEERDTTRTFANHAALALKKAKLLDQLGKARNTAQIVARVTALENLDDTLELVAQGTIEVVNGDAVTLYIHDQDSGKLSHVPTMIGVRFPDRASRHPEIRSDSLILEMLKQDRPYIVNDISADSLFSNTRFAKDEQVKSCVAIPLRVGAEKVGVMFVNFRRVHRFTDDELSNIELFANQAAVAIRNAQLYDQAQSRARLLDAAAQVARGATAILDVGELIDETVRLISECFSFYHVGVFLLDDNRAYAVLQAASKEGRRMLKRGHKLKVGQEGIVGYVTQIGRYHLAPEVEKESHHLANPDLPLTRSEMVFPLIARGQVIGALDVQSAEVVYLQEEDIAALQTMADQLANAIDNARLYEQVTERLEEATALKQAAVSLAGASELEQVLKLIVAEAMKLTSTEESSVVIWDAQAEEFTQALRIHADGTIQPYKTQARTHEGRARQIIDRRRPIAISDARQVPDFNPVFFEKGYRATLGAPLVSQGEVIGVFYVRSKKVHQFSDREVALIEALASQAAVAIDRTRQYEEMKKIKGYIGSNTAIDWIKMVSTAWGHSIRREVGTARGRVALLRSLLTKKESTQEVQQELARLENVISGIKEIPITAPLSYEDAVDPVCINELLKTYLERQWRHVSYKSVELCFDLQEDLDSIAIVWASREWLRRGLEIVVDNSVWAMLETDSPKKQITVATQLEGDILGISIADTGPGISDDVLQDLFKKPIDKPAGSRGAGIGLMLAQTIFQTYRGDIRVDSTGPEGTNVVIVLPVEAQKKKV